MTGADGQAAALRQVCDRLSLEISAVQHKALLEYLTLLQRWNATYNLTAVRDPAAMLNQHMADCLAVVSPLIQQASACNAPRNILDVGSGAGLPGVVLAVMLPDWRVTCVDRVAKKAAFVRQVAGTLQLSHLSVQHARVERLGAHYSESFGIVTARAFSSLGELVALTSGWLHPAGVWMAMKGQPPRTEIEALPPHVDVFHVEPLGVPGLDAQRCLVWMRRRHDS